jgi:hypothetical protein
MISAALIPDPDPLSAAAPVWLFRLLLWLTFFLHLVPMNLVLGGSLLVLWARLRPGLPVREEVVRWFTAMLPVAVAATVTFGVAALLFSQVLYGRLLYTSSILIGWWWLSVIPIVILAYYAVYLSAFRGERWSQRVGLAMSGLTAVCFIAVSFIYSTNMSLMIRPSVFDGKYQSAPWGTNLNLGDPTWFPRWSHMVLGAVAVAALAIAWHGYAAWKRGELPSSQLYRYGIGVFCFATGLNLVVGTVFLLSFPRDLLLELLRYSPAGTTELVAGFATGFVALGLAVLALQARHPSLFLGGTLAATLVTLILMLLLRDSIREVSLVGVVQPPSSVEPQWTPIVLFALLLAGAASTVWWMVRKLGTEPRS